MRIFISLNISDDVKNRIKKVQDKLKEAFKDQSIKWETPDKFHLTLRFLGEVSDEYVDRLSNKLSNLKFNFKEIILNTTRIGFFPNQRRPNIIYLGFDEQTNFIDEVLEKIDSALKIFGFLPDKKFIPHLTMGRYRRDEHKRSCYINIDVTDKIEIILNSFFIMKSQLASKGSVHTIIKEIKF